MIDTSPSVLEYGNTVYRSFMLIVSDFECLMWSVKKMYTFLKQMMVLSMGGCFWN